MEQGLVDAGCKKTDNQGEDMGRRSLLTVDITELQADPTGSDDAEWEATANDGLATDATR